MFTLHSSIDFIRKTTCLCGRLGGWWSGPCLHLGSYCMVSSFGRRVGCHLPFLFEQVQAGPGRPRYPQVAFKNLRSGYLGQSLVQLPGPTWAMQGPLQVACLGVTQAYMVRPKLTTATWPCLKLLRTIQVYLTLPLGSPRPLGKLLSESRVTN